MEKMVLYSTHCPRCKVISKKLDELNAEYIVIDDIDKINQFAEEHNLREAPILVNEEGEILTFSDALKYINKLMLK